MASSNPYGVEAFKALPTPYLKELLKNVVKVIEEKKEQKECLDKAPESYKAREIAFGLYQDGFLYNDILTFTILEILREKAIKDGYIPENLDEIKSELIEVVSKRMKDIQYIAIWILLEDKKLLTIAQIKKFRCVVCKKITGIENKIDCCEPCKKKYECRGAYLNN